MISLAFSFAATSSAVVTAVAKGPAFFLIHLAMPAASLAPWKSPASLPSTKYLSVG
jgi:hypothetical protein